MFKAPAMEIGSVGQQASSKTTGLGGLFEYLNAWLLPANTILRTPLSVGARLAGEER
ncbi:hypothetical protein [Pseudomonas sp. NPDC087336]|uniref:hypothetical protein n=1 Tax=Pseudomonas sp. NPDC087336 TaxID=3364436 RepID=UPI0037FC9AD2